jgi:hypothetical protein
MLIDRFRCLYHGKAFTLMPPHLPLTSANICRVIRNSPSPPAQHFAVPYVLKLLGETQEGVETLAAFQAVSFAGAAVPDDLGDRLVAAGVNLMSQYGTTGKFFLTDLQPRADVSRDWRPSDFSSRFRCRQRMELATSRRSHQAIYGAHTPWIRYFRSGRPRWMASEDHVES